MEFRLDYTLTDQDYLNFNLFHTFASKSGKKQFWRMRLLMAVSFLVIGLFYLLLYGFHSDGYFYLCAFALAGIFMFFIYKSILRNAVKRQIKNYKKHGKLPYSPVVSMTFTDESITECTDTSKSEYTYATICDVYLVNDRILYLYMDALRAFILPVSAFESKAQLDAFLQMIEKKTVPVAVCDFERSPYMEPVFSENT